MSTLTEERLFKDFAHALYKIAPSITVYHFHEVVINPWTKKTTDKGEVFVVGGKRYSTAKPAILDMMAALNKVNVYPSAELLWRLAKLYGEQDHA